MPVPACVVSPLLCTMPLLSGGQSSPSAPQSVVSGPLPACGRPSRCPSSCPTLVIGRFESTSAYCSVPSTLQHHCFSQRPRPTLVFTPTFHSRAPCGLSHVQS